MKYKSTYKHAIITAAITTAVFISVTFFSCSKQEGSESGIYTISGTVYEDCNKKPFATQQLQLVHIASSGACADQLLKTYTDSYGNFSFSYDGSCKEYLLSDEYQIVMLTGNNTGSILYTRIPGKQNVQLKDMYAYRKSILPVKIFGASWPARRDTLYIGINESTFYTVAPIKPLDTVLSFTTPTQIYNGGQMDVKVYYAVGKEFYKKVLNQPTVQNAFTLSFHDCNTKSDDTLRIPIQ